MPGEFFEHLPAPYAPGEDTGEGIHLPYDIDNNDPVNRELLGSQESTSEDGERILFNGETIDVGADFQEYQIVGEPKGPMYLQSPDDGSTLLEGENIQYIYPTTLRTSGNEQPKDFLYVQNMQGQLGVIESGTNEFVETGELDYDAPSSRIPTINVPGEENNGNDKTYFKLADNMSDSFISIPDGEKLFEDQNLFINTDTEIFYNGERFFIASQTTPFNLQGTSVENPILVNSRGKTVEGVNSDALDTAMFGEIIHTDNGGSIIKDLDGNFIDIFGNPVENPEI